MSGIIFISDPASHHLSIIEWWLWWRQTSMKDDHQWKMTSNGRRPQNIERGISQQPLIGSYSNSKLKLRGQNHSLLWVVMKTTKPKLKTAWNENLTLSKEEYLSNLLLDITLILNLSWSDQPKIEICLKWRHHPMEDDLKSLKVEYLSNHCFDLLKFQT